MCEFIVKTQHAHYECDTKESLNEKVNALRVLKLPFQIFKNFSGEYMPLLVPAENYSYIKVVK